MKLLTFKEFLLEANDNPDPKNIKKQIEASRKAITDASRKIMAKVNVGDNTKILEFHKKRVTAMEKALSTPKGLK